MSRAKLSLSLYKANLSLLRHSSSCILCGISNSFIQIHIANSCTCFSCASLLRTMRYNAAGAQLHCAPDRTLGYAILFSLPFSPKHIGALRVHELRFVHDRSDLAPITSKHIVKGFWSSPRSVNFTTLGSFASSDFDHVKARDVIWIKVKVWVEEQKTWRERERERERA